MCLCFTLDGKALGATRGLTHEDHPAGLIGTNAVAGLAATDGGLSVHRGAVEREDPFRPQPLLRWHAVADEFNACIPSVPDLDAAVNCVPVFMRRLQLCAVFITQTCEESI